MPKFNVDFTVSEYGTIEGVEAENRWEAEQVVLGMDTTILRIFVNGEEASAYAEEVTE